MKNLKFLLLLLIILSMSMSDAYSNAKLSILNPTKSTQRYPGSIYQMVITVKPQGTYVEYGVYLTFSPKGSGFSNKTDSLEIEFKFNLPENSFVNESWLWFQNIYVIGKIMDRWSANLIYENQVNRIRRDPSVLFKNSQLDYELRVFPLFGDTLRKVKINYFTALQLTETNATADIAVDFANSSNQPLSKEVRVLFFGNNDFANPRFPGDSTVKFDSTDDYKFGKCLQAIIPLGYEKNISKIMFDSPIKKGVFFSSEKDTNNNQFYQLAFIPKAHLNLYYPKKVVFLVDFDSLRSDYKKSDVFKNLKESMLKTLQPFDQFNIFISNKNIYPQYEDWMPADTANINNALSFPEGLAGTSNLGNLIRSSTDWISQKGDSCTVLIIASSGKHGSQDTANSLLEYIQWHMPSFVTVYVSAFVTKNWENYQVGALNYVANDYLFTNLCALKAGIYRKVQDNGGNLGSLYSATLNDILGNVDQLDIRVSTSDGFCFSKFLLGADGNDFLTKNLLLEIGKYLGNPPIDISLTGFYRGIPFAKRIFMDSSVLSKENYSVSKLWNANNIKYIETKKPQNPVTIHEILHASKANKILSIYTAFLALEPTQEDSLYHKDDENVPVELYGFYAEYVAGKVLLNWATASELNSERFEIERLQISGNSQSQFIKIAEQKAAGYSNSVKEYGPIIDNDITIGNSYIYRIKMIDIDGSFAYSEERIINTTDDKALFVGEVYPNPAKSNLKLDVQLGTKRIQEITIFNILGMPVKLPYQLNSNKLNIDVLSLENGMYTLQIKADGQCFFRKFTVSK